MDMIERVARAIWSHPTRCDLRYVVKGPCALDDECSCWRIVVESASAAIEAMREPTDTMWDAGERYCDEWSPNYVWRAMIDAALNPVPSPNTQTAGTPKANRD